MNPKEENPLEPLQRMSLTEEEADRILCNLRTIMQAEEENQSPIRSAKRRFSWGWRRIQSVAAGGIAVVVLGGVIWGTTHVQQTSENGGSVIMSQNPTSSATARSLTLHAFDASKDWQPSTGSTYTPGLTEFTPPQLPEGPSAFEESVWPKSGIAEIDVSKGTQATAGNWKQPIVFNSDRLNINDQTYTVPAKYAHQKLFVLPLANGIVWAAGTAPLRDWSLLQQALQGQTPIYYTPYQGHGASLDAGAQTIAALPRGWMGLDGPTATSAWSGWLPAGSVAEATVKPITDYFLQLGQHGQVQVSAPERGTIQSWPTLFKRALTQSAYFSKPHYLAAIGGMTRTAGGFTLQVRLTDAMGNGRNSGLVSADYYWSETTRKWTPLAQIQMVQDVSGSFLAGSNAVYWTQLLPEASQSGNALDATEMYFNPKTLTMQSIWLGDWYEGTGYVDGSSLVTVKAGDVTASTNSSRAQWAVYAPEASGGGGNGLASGNAAFDTSVTFPNGQVLKPNQPTTWQGLNVTLQVSSIPSPAPSPAYATMLDNHLTILSHQQISTSAGKATLVLAESTPPAASGSTKATYEYWAIVTRSQYGYAIKGTFAGDRKVAKAAMLGLVKRWKVPS